MDRWLIATARLVGAAAGAFAGIVAVQLMRMRRMEFLPGWPGFAINHIIMPSTGEPVDPTRLNIVVLGDSTTAGVGVSRPEDALPYLLARRIADAETRSVRVVSYGWAGARVADLPRQQVRRAGAKIRPNDRGPFLPDADIVAVVIGSNDATHQTPPNRYRADLRATLEGIRKQAPTARIVLAGIPAFRGALPALEPLIFLADQFGRLLRPISRAEAARVGAAYADLQSHVPALLAGREDVLSSDKFHPSAVGYDAWAEVIFDALQTGPAMATPDSDPPLEAEGA
ncbi:MAG TPA: SGNH/GDSL hydrolase family protein [Candidatus Limnocylindrales bacterium]|nr:SGNH/GDSL hydrolase family protein [Candidatus Limnocylindrales bacterium]